jgi:meso-butanediol dehydrogenase/(S,S)-butanediol dehydrogenase/diacetyl reductase
MYRLDGKVALCTGAGRHDGLGAAILRRLAAEGARVVVTDLGTPNALMGSGHIGTADELEAVAASLRATGAEAIAVPLDVRDEAQVQAAVAAAVAAFGRLDVLVNNAGIGYLMESLLDVTKERWQAVLDVNLMGAFLCTKHAARRMIEQGGGGRIVNVASQAAKSGHMHMAAYTSSKHGLVGFTRTAAMELGPHGITVNAVCPNHVTTGLGAVQNEYFAKLRGFPSVDAYLADMRNRIPMRRVGLAEDTAAACAWLCSDEAAYVTGEAMNVSGGVEMH